MRIIITIIVMIFFILVNDSYAGWNDKVYNPNNLPLGEKKADNPRKNNYKTILPQTTQKNSNNDTPNNIKEKQKFLKKRLSR